jgi:hypothetical protein
VEGNAAYLVTCGREGTDGVLVQRLLYPDGRSSIDRECIVENIKLGFEIAGTLVLGVAVLFIVYIRVFVRPATQGK